MPSIWGQSQFDRAGATARRHHPNPAEAHRRWRGERSEPVRLGVRSHTHALFAREVQRKLSNGIAGFAALGSWRQATAALARTRPQHHSHDVFGNARRLEHHRSAMRPVVVPVLAAMAGPITPSMSSTTACSVAATGVPRERAAATNAAITRQCQSAVNRQAEAAVRAERMERSLAKPRPPAITQDSLSKFRACAALASYGKWSRVGRCLPTFLGSSSIFSASASCRRDRAGARPERTSGTSFPARSLTVKLLLPGIPLAWARAVLGDPVRTQHIDSADLQR
jgi:hypothetical protein